MCQMSAMYIRSRICRLPPHSVSPSHYINTANNTRHTYFSDHSRHGQFEDQDTFSNTVYFCVSHYPTPNMRPTPAMFQQAARSAPGFLQRLAKSPMSPPVEVLPILILPVGMLSFAAYTGSREFKYDRNLRLKRTNVAAMQEHMQEH